MGFKIKGFTGRKTFPRGIHPAGNKDYSSQARLEMFPPPGDVLLPLQQHIGAPCEPKVKPRQMVTYGDLIGRSEVVISAALHAPISGKVQKLTVTTLPNGRHMQAIHIKAEGDQLDGEALREEMFGGEWPTRFNGDHTPLDITHAIADAGIVGLGGAAFPTHVKVIPSEKKPVDTLLVNGCECEPFLTADDRLMRDYPRAIVSGALLASMATSARSIIVGIESNKPQAIEAMRQAAGGTGIVVAVLKTKYPQGSERHLIKAITGRTMPLGGLPADIGVAVSNVATMAAVARAVLRNKPLTHRLVCVTGSGIQTPKNILVPIGTRYRALIDYCGGLTPDAARIVSGGPMMGFAFTDLDMPITKGTGGVTVLTHADVRRERETNCIRCGRCVDVCPMHLVPAKLAAAAKHGDLALADRYNIMGCMESGCCGYICPANIPLVQLIRMGKALVMAQRRSK
jgi:electron transport complex protein RnfC